MVKKLTPMQRQYLELKRQYPDSILMFRLGDFYEMFNEDAEKASKILDIVLTARGEGVEKWPMCGVPYHAVDSYVAKLIHDGYTVAIAEQVEDPSQARGLVRREIVRLITPGTVVEASMLEDATNNFLVALATHEGRVGIAAVDVSTGEFLATELKAELTDDRVMTELTRLSPAEILLPDSIAKKKKFNSGLERLDTKITPRNDFDFSTRAAEQRILQTFNVATLEGYGIADWPAALGAAGAIMAYLQDVHKENTVLISGIRTYHVESHMIIDATTQRNLELIRNARDGSSRGTLLSVLSRTTTPMGKRLIKRWILQPLLDIDEIKRRHDAVEDLARSAAIRRKIMESLRPLGDLERITSRILFGTAGARELVALREALGRLPAVKASLTSSGAELLIESTNSIDPLRELQETLTRAIVDDPPVTVREGNMIRQGYSKELDELKRGIADDKKWIASLQARERQRTGIKSLKVGYTKVFGYYIEVTKANLRMVPDDYERKQTLVNAERFITPELKKREAAVLSGEERINRLEFEIFESLREMVKEKADILRRNAGAIAVIDVLASLADVAVTRRYVRPTITKETAIKIIDGRHPSLEMILGPNEFVPNSLEIGDSGKTLIIVTGPNMAGKSTYMRQAALIVLLAQMGAFVPAKSAEIGLVDRIFTRVGAFDDLTARQSTFMVEMVETANILNSATERSLVILDEIGRGTSTFDGMALAWAVAERIVQMKTRTLFATHFHQLTDMANLYHGVKNVHTLARETGNRIVFLHKVVDGGTDKSYGVHVASLAGIPETVVQRAKEILQQLEQQNVVDLSGAIETPEKTAQTTLEALIIDDPIVDQIRHMDLDRTTPIDALLALKEMQDEIRKR